MSGGQSGIGRRWIPDVRVLCVILGLFAGGSLPFAAWAGQSPLLIPGKKTLYQRVLARTGVALRNGPGPAAPELPIKVPPMSPLYVFNSTVVNGEVWLELGAGQSRAEGWLPAEQTLSWNQTLTAKVAAPINRERVLFFRRAEDLERLYGGIGASAEIRKLIDAADQGRLPPTSQVIACEPPEPPGQGQFYVQPILEVKPYTTLRYSARFLRVAVETLRGKTPLIRPDKPTLAQIEQIANPEKLKNQQAAVIFVLDTTVSMSPYIDRVRQAVRSLFLRLATSQYGNKIAFGVVAFRSDLNRVKALEYNTRLIADLHTPQDSASFFRKLDQAVATTVSSDEFDEDALAGVDMARTLVSDKYHSTFIVLVTDAGTKEGIRSTTRQSAESMNRLVRETKVPTTVISTMHLLTPAGQRAKNHDSASAQYLSLSYYPNSPGGYFPIRDGSVEEFGKAIDAIADTVRSQIERAHKGQAIDAPPPPPPSTAAEISIADTVHSRLELIGRSMQLQYLGEVGKRQAPRVVDAWIGDRDPAHKFANAIAVHALITKNQLDQIARAIDTIKQKGEESRGRSTDFFSQLRIISSIGLRNADNVNETKIERLAEFGGIDEYIDGLPYISELLATTEERWISKRASEQREFLDRLDALRKNYAEYAANERLWTDIEGTAGNTGDDVMQIPLEDLP